MPRNKKGTQPILVPTGGPMGQRQQLEAAQSAIPLPAAPGPGSPPSAAGPAPGGEGPPPVERPDVFGPSQRPDEPLTAGAALGPGQSSMGLLPDDPVLAMRAALMQSWDPDLARYLERSVK